MASHFRIARWFREALPDVQPRLRSDSIPALLKAGVAGVGAVVLPTFAAAQEPRLLRVTPPIEGPEMDLWVLSHPDVRGNARVRALAGFLADAVTAELERLAEAGAACRQFADCPMAPRRRRGAARIEPAPRLDGSAR